MSRPKYHIMLDIETLGTKPGCPIWQVAAIGMSEEGMLDGGDIDLLADVTVTPTDCLKEPGVCKLTTSWQLEKNMENYYAAFHVGLEGGTPKLAQEFFLEITKAIAKLREEADYRFFWWSKSITFDYPILEEALDAQDLTLPWKYWELQELRTALLLVGMTGKESRGQFNTHQAFDDAVHQMQLLSRVIQKLEGV